VRRLAEAVAVVRDGDTARVRFSRAGDRLRRHPRRPHRRWSPVVLDCGIGQVGAGRDGVGGGAGGRDGLGAGA